MTDSALQQFLNFTGAEENAGLKIIRFVEGKPELWSDPEFPNAFSTILDCVTSRVGISAAMDIPDSLLGLVIYGKIESEDLKTLCLQSMLDRLPDQWRGDVDVHVLGTICSLIEAMPEDHPLYPQLLAQTHQFLGLIRRGEGLGFDRNAKQLPPLQAAANGLKNAHHYITDNILRACASYNRPRMRNL